MINQQLLDYMYQQLTGGVAKEIIKTNLTSQGWSEQDIIEGFIAIEKSTITPTPQTPPASSMEQSAPIQSAQVLMEQASMASPAATETSMWAKGIPKTNKAFMGASLALVFGVDFIILLISGFSLFMFWAIMLVVFGVFTIFFFIENRVLSRKFADTKSALDKWIVLLITLRNLVFILNFIPGIQILGLFILGGFASLASSILVGTGIGDLGGLLATQLIMPGMLVLYVILIALRFEVTRRATLTPSYTN